MMSPSFTVFRNKDVFFTADLGMHFSFDEACCHVGFSPQTCTQAKTMQKTVDMRMRYDLFMNNLYLKMLVFVKDRQ